MAAKTTAHRPSQAHLEYVTNSKGEKVRNTAFRGKIKKTRNRNDVGSSASIMKSRPTAPERIDDSQRGTEVFDLQDKVRFVTADGVIAEREGEVVGMEPDGGSAWVTWDDYPQRRRRRRRPTSSTSTT